MRGLGRRARDEATFRLRLGATTALGAATTCLCPTSVVPIVFFVLVFFVCAFCGCVSVFVFSLFSFYNLGCTSCFAACTVSAVSTPAAAAAALRRRTTARKCWVRATVVCACAWPPHTTPLWHSHTTRWRHSGHSRATGSHPAGTCIHWPRQHLSCRLVEEHHWGHDIGPLLPELTPPQLRTPQLLKLLELERSAHLLRIRQHRLNDTPALTICTNPVMKPHLRTSKATTGCSIPPVEGSWTRSRGRTKILEDILLAHRVTTVLTPRCPRIRTKLVEVQLPATAWHARTTTACRQCLQ